MMEWVLLMWLASAPNALFPAERFNSKAECLTAKRDEIAANMAIGLGRGATYFCDKDAAR